MATKYKVNYELKGDSTVPVTRTECIKHGNSMLDTVINSKADASTVSSLATTVNGKADTTTVSNLTTRVSSNETNIATQTARIDSIAALPSGSTSGDAELMDIRVGDDGKNYTSAGASVRSQISDIKSNLKDLRAESESFVDKSNLFDERTIINNKDLNSTTGEWKDDNRYFVSAKIYTDFTVRLSIGGTTGKYFYCYDDGDVYLGRIQVDSAVIVANTYPTTKYIRVIGAYTTGTKLSVRHALSGFVPEDFNPVADFIAKYGKRHFVSSALSGDGNLFDYNNRIENIDFSSGNASFSYSENYYFTHPIEIDIDKKIAIAGTSYPNAFCYNDNMMYLGRLSQGSSGYINIKSAYPTTKYIIVGAKNDETSMSVSYSEYQIKSGLPCVRKTDVKPSTRIRVETYNTGDFTGVGSDVKTKMRNLIANGNADILATQEDVAYAFEDVPSNTVYNMFKNKERIGNTNYNYKSVSTQYAVKANIRVSYGTSTYGEEKYNHPFFQHTAIIIKGIEVNIINVHLDWQDKGWRGMQITKILNYISYLKNVIVCGDFNPEDYTNGVKNSNNLTYEAELQRFIDAGYTPANAGYFGVMNTVADPTEVSAGNVGPFDNIIVSSNIKISNAYVREADYMNDHKLFGADLIID